LTLVVDIWRRKISSACHRVDSFFVLDIRQSVWPTAYSVQVKTDPLHCFLYSWITGIYRHIKLVSHINKSTTEKNTTRLKKSTTENLITVLVDLNRVASQHHYTIIGPRPLDSFLPNRSLQLVCIVGKLEASQLPSLLARPYKVTECKSACTDTCRARCERDYIF
jgi:hypothetical protein